MVLSARLSAGLCMAFLAVATPTVFADQNVTADHGVAAGGDIRDTTITIGYSLEEVQAFVKAERQELKTTYQAQIKDLSQRLEVTQDAVIGFFAILKREHVPLEKMTETLAAIAQRHREMLDRLAVLDPDDPAIKALIREARTALAKGDYDRADLLLHRAEAAELEAARQAQAAANKRLLKSAVARAERGEISLTRLRYREAARHFKAASSLVPNLHPQEQGAYLRRSADALGEYGDQQGNNEALREAIAAYHEALGVLTQEHMPLDWAGTQNNLGNVLSRLGTREPGTSRLEAAVSAYRSALEERTRERVPLDWAATQTNLGNALRMLGEREPGTSRLEEAVAAFRSALEAYTRERVPLYWALTQNNLGIALSLLGERESGTSRLEEAVVAYRLALEERTRERVPLHWAMTQTNLADTLQALGEREPGTLRFEEAVGAYRLALEERTRERVPRDWAMTQNKLGTALSRLGERENSIEHLRQAEVAIQSVYSVYQEAGYRQYNEYFEKRLHALRQRIETLRSTTTPR